RHRQFAAKFRIPARLGVNLGHAAPPRRRKRVLQRLAWPPPAQKPSPAPLSAAVCRNAACHRRRSKPQTRHRRGGRVVEGTPLLRAQMVLSRLEGSNPFLSATTIEIIDVFGFFCPMP